MSENKSVFQTLSAIDTSKLTKPKGKLDYIPWSVAVREVSKRYPDFSWEFTMFDGLPFLATVTGFYVECCVTINGVSRKQMRPVMDFTNRAMMEPTAMDIDKAQQRALTKAIALHGFGLELWAGEDYDTTELKIEAQEDKAVKDIEEYSAWKKIAVAEYMELDSPKAVQTRCTAHIRRATKMNDKAFISELAKIRDNRIKELMGEGDK